MNTPPYWKDLEADFRALRDERGDDVDIPNDDGSWRLDSGHRKDARDKDRAGRFRDLATSAAFTTAKRVKVVAFGRRPVLTP